MLRCLWVSVLLLACDDATTEGEESALSGDCRRDGCAEGETCNDWSDRGTWVCEALLEFGEDCTASDECASGFCPNLGAAEPRYCSKSCALDEDCDDLAGYVCDDSRGPAATFCRREE